MKSTDPTGVMPGYSPGQCPSVGGTPVNFPDRLFTNDGGGRFTDITGGADGDYDTAGDNPLPFFHSFRTYDADLTDVNNDGFLDVVRADRALCAGEPSHYFKNVDITLDGVPDNEFQGLAMGMPTEDAYWDNLATGDLDGDGDLDLLISHAGSATAPHAIEINDGTGSFTLYNPATMAPTHAAADDFFTYTDIAHDMALVDLDDDRDQDIIIGGGTIGPALPNFVLLNRFVETGELFFNPSRSRGLPSSRRPSTWAPRTSTATGGAMLTSSTIGISSARPARFLLNLGAGRLRARRRRQAAPTGSPAAARGR